MVINVKHLGIGIKRTTHSTDLPPADMASACAVYVSTERCGKLHWKCRVSTKRRFPADYELIH